MDLQSLKDKLEKERYKVFFKKSDNKKDSMPDYLLGGIPSDETNLEMDSVFQVFLENKRFLLSFPNFQVSINNYFETEESLVHFIKGKFPIKQR